MALYRFALPLAATLLLSSALHAASAAPNRTLACAPPVPIAASTGSVLVGFEDGYILRTNDGGASWTALDPRPQGKDVVAIAIGSGGTLLAGLRGGGLIASTDNGGSWQASSLNRTAPDATISALAVDPRDGQQVYAATDAGPLYGSTDGGTTWHAYALPHGLVAATLALSPAALYAGTQRGVLSSADGGSTWQPTGAGIPPATTVHTLVTDPRSPLMIYAATTAGLFVTRDGGANWQREQGGSATSAILDQQDITAVAIDPFDAATVIAGDGEGLIYRTHDGGRTWQEIGSGLSSAHETIPITGLIFDPAHPGTALGGDGAGDLLTGTNHGQEWSPNTGTGWSATGARPISFAMSTSLIRPTDPVAAPTGRQASLSYFPTTHHTVRGPFLGFFNHYGGTAIFGLPLSESFISGRSQVQYFERACLLRTNGQIALAPLGQMATAGRAFPAAAPRKDPTQRVFAATRHTLAGRFLTYWMRHHGDLVFGAPISEPLYEQNGDRSGHTYLVQYFTNARLEYHPELAGTRYEVQVGLLGRQVLLEHGWL